MSKEELERLNAALWAVKPSLQANVPIAELRLTLEKLTRPAPPEATIEPVDAGGVPAEWVSVPGSGEVVILYMHGGGYALGSVASRRSFGARIGRVAGARVLLVDFRLAPEHTFPAALEDVLTAYGFLVAGGIPPARIVLMGDSVGGGLVLASLVQLRDAGDRLPAAGVTISAWADLALTGDSMNSRANRDAMHYPETLAMLAATYLNSADPRDPRASPLFADLSGLPPLLLVVGTEEVFYDDTIRVAAKARSAGVDVTVEEGIDMSHDYPLSAPVLEERQQAVERIGKFIRARTGVSVAE
jgi:acetyl esterase/lipase